MESMSVSQVENEGEGEKVLETTDPLSCRQRAIRKGNQLTVRLKDITSFGA